MKTVTEVQRISLGVLANLEPLHCSIGRHCKAYIGEGGWTDAGSGRILEQLRPVPSSASTSCESAVRGPDRRTTPSLSNKPLAQDAAAVPPETPGTMDLIF